MISYLEIILQLLLAAILGGVIGIERERKSWFAGLRTHMLVCMGSTLIMIVSQYGFENTLHSGLVVLDPSRIAAQVVSGIGFLGAGTIIFWKNKIKGLTTAASLWTVAAVGLSIGGGLYIAAIVATVLIFAVLAILKPVEKLFFKTSELKEVRFSVDPEFSLAELETILKNRDISIMDLQIEKKDEADFIYLVTEFSSESMFLHLVNDIKNLQGVNKIEIL